MWHRTYSVCSKNNNTWYIQFNKATEENKYRGVESLSFHYYSIYEYEHGLRVIKPLPVRNEYKIYGVSVYNGHLFRRYRERLNLPVSSPEKLIDSFFRHNHLVTGTTRKDTYLNQQGILLGERIQHEFGVFKEYRTFVSFDLLFEEQREIKEELMDQLDYILNNNVPYHMPEGLIKKILETDD